MGDPEQIQIHVFIAYSRKDTDMLGELVSHLSVLERNAIVTRIWYDGKIGAGAEWDNEIKENLKKSDIILLLISSDFIASEYSYSEEMTKALQLHEDKKAIVVPIILRKCLWEDTPFAKLQVLPKDALPVINWDNKDEPFADITIKIRDLAIERRTQKEIDLAETLAKNHTIFLEKIGKAETLLGKKKWKDAIHLFMEAKAIYSKEFTPPLEEINAKISSCEIELEFSSTLARAEKPYQNGDYLEALMLLETCYSIKPDDKVSELISNCRNFVNLQKPIFNLELEINILKKEIANLKKAMNEFVESSTVETLTNRIDDLSEIYNGEIKTKLNLFEEKIQSLTKESDDKQKGQIEFIKSPMVGTFYRAENPEKPAYVKVGDLVSKGTVVCIIEAMKLFNEIETEVSGRITKVLVEDAQPVEYDQPLFEVLVLGN